MESLTFGLLPKPPFRLEYTVWVLRRRARNIVDRWDGAVYRRVLMIGDIPVEVAVTQIGSHNRPRLAVTVTAKHSTRELQQRVAGALSRMLGLRVELAPFYALAARDKRLAPLVDQFRGVKPTCFPSVFESLVNAIACQQLSLTVGIELLNRLATRCGPEIRENGLAQHAFPRPEDLIHVKAQTFRSLGFSYNKAQYILDLSRSLTTGEFSPKQLEQLEDSSAVESLISLRGVGRWTAEYVLLRGLGRTSMFPGDDVGARNRLAVWLGRDGPLDYESVKRAVRRWQPYAGLVYFHLLLAGLNQSGALSLQPAGAS
jgi:DNA-3-methyladenine glycosylase II